MGIFRRRSPEPTLPPGPTPFITEVLHRIGEEYGGFDAVGPLPRGADGPGTQVTIHIAGDPGPGRDRSLRGSGIARTARAFTDRTEVYDGDRLIARFDDLTTADVFGTRHQEHP